MSQVDAWQELNWRSVVLNVTDSWHILICSAKEYTREVLEHLIIAILIYIVLSLVLYVGIVRWNILEFRRDIKKAKRILIVIAHPDDECMFFGPTVLNFTHKKDCVLYLMCLSTGTNYGLGKVRKNELYESCKVLGIDDNNIIVQTHTELPDCMSTKWPPELVAQMIENQVEAYSIDTLITFDKHGISRHLNHSSIYYAVAHLSIERRLPKNCKVFVLETVNVIRKYWFFFDIPLCFLLSRNRFILNSWGKGLVTKAMKQHKSQLVWFRRLYLLFSRYVFINTLQEMDILDIELDLEIDD